MYLRLFLLWLAVLAAPLASRAQLFISEVMAENSTTLADEDGDFEDWVEIWNASTGTVSLSGWYLTDNANDLQKWRFPAVSLTSGARKVVFCSNKDRRNANANLHTNFKLNNNGEYLALVRSDGGTVEHHYSPKFPKTGPDLAYGLPGDPGWQKLATYTAAARAIVPTAASTTWYAQTNFDDSLWRDVTQGVGYDTTGVYTGLFGFAGNFQFDMYTKRAQVWLRQKFTLPSTNGITGLRLQLKYDDGVKVWINNKVMFEDNVPTDTVWTATAPTNRADGLNNAWTTIPITGGETNLVNGVNLLAIQTFNFGASDTDALLVNEVEGYMANGGTNLPATYLYTPTPGQPNALGNPAVGPFVSFVSNSPARPSGLPGAAPLTVFAKVEQSLNPVSTVRMYYRHMFSNEVMVTMTALMTNGLYSAQIPVSNMAPGQMVRWRIAGTDSNNVTVTAPAFIDPLQNDQYYGTVAMDYTSNSLLPLVHWFCTNATSAGSLSGARCSYFYLGRFYDNVYVNQHGQSTAGFAKKSLNVDFNFDNRFTWKDGEKAEKDINFMSNYADKTRTRNTLAWDMNRRTGAPWFWVFPVRIHLNGSFHGVFDMMEDSDDRWLDRIGMDGDGALYKAYDSMATVGGAEKKTRQWEDKSDYQSLIDNLNTAISLSTRRQYAYDNVDMARCANYLATLDIVSSEDHGHKNYFVYRDTFITGEWMLLPWDEDLTFGHNWMTSVPGYYDDGIFNTNMLYFTRSGGNRFYQLIYNAPEINQMHLRRIRTLLDTVLMTNGTPTNQLIVEAKMNEILDTLDPPNLGTNSDAYLDYIAWSSANLNTNLTGTGGWGYLTNRQSRQEAPRVLYDHLPGRRAFLASTGAYSFGYFIPASQPPQMPIRFGAMDVKPTMGTQEYFSIVNTNNIYVDISGWSVTGAVRYTFKPGTVIPPGGGTNENIGKLFVAKSPKGFRSRTAAPTAGQYCYVQGPYDGQLSARGESLYLMDETGYPIASTSWATNTTTAMQNHVRVSEIMYNPAPPTLAESNSIPYCQAHDFEYIEVRFIGSGFMLTSGPYFEFTDGVEFRHVPTSFFPYNTSTRFLFVANTNAFYLRYGSNLASLIKGTYTGLLDNAGERIRLVDNIGEVILDFSYDADWYPSTDGHGFSLVIKNEFGPWDSWDKKESWRPSGVLKGTPGAVDPGDPGITPVLINEALTHTDLPQVDSIELWNPTALAANIGNWWLTDDFAVPKKYRIPTNTFIAANSFLSFDESQFNEPTNALIPFRLSSTGDDVWLFSADGTSNMNLTGYATTRKFGAAQNGVSFGRFVNRAADEFFVQQDALTLGLTNAYPRIWPVVISEIMYHPLDFASILATNDNDRDEFIELTSVSTSNTPLYDLNFPTNTWHIRNAVDYDFPPNITLAPGASLILVGFDPNLGTNATAFRNAYGIPTNVPLFGPWSGKLDNSAEQIELKRPDTPNTNGVPYIIVEEIDYRDTAPWPALADGTGKSLQRIELNAFGNDPYNWFAAAPVPNAPTDTSLDTDGDGAPDWAEHRAGTDPANPASYLYVISAASSATGTLVRWTGQYGRTYTLEASTNLLGTPAFTPLTTGINALNPENLWLDTATNTARFYRIRVEP